MERTSSNNASEFLALVIVVHFASNAELPRARAILRGFMGVQAATVQVNGYCQMTTAAKTGQQGTSIGTKYRNVGKLNLSELVVLQMSR